MTHDGYISWLQALEGKKPPELGAGVGVRALKREVLIQQSLGFQWEGQ